MKKLLFLKFAYKMHTKFVNNLFILALSIDSIVVAVYVTLLLYRE